MTIKKNKSCLEPVKDNNLDKEELKAFQMKYVYLVFYKAAAQNFFHSKAIFSNQHGGTVNF